MIGPMRYRLRTLLIVLALGPPILACGHWALVKWQRYRQMMMDDVKIRLVVVAITSPVPGVPNPDPVDPLPPEQLSPAAPQP